MEKNVNEENTKQLTIMRENFKSLRQSNDWSIKELSEISGIDKKILTDIEEGRDFDIVYLFRLCRCYDIAPHKIFFQIQ